MVLSSPPSFFGPGIILLLRHFANWQARVTIQSERIGDCLRNQNFRSGWLLLCHSRWSSKSTLIKTAWTGATLDTNTPEQFEASKPCNRRKGADACHKVHGCASNFTPPVDGGLDRVWHTEGKFLLYNTFSHCIIMWICPIDICEVSVHRWPKRAKYLIIPSIWPTSGPYVWR